MNRYAEIYTGTVQIASFEPGKEAVVSSFTIYVKGLQNVMLVYKSPKKDIGKKILLKQKQIWFYFPKVGKAIIMSQISTLSGSVSVGDLAAPPLLDLYDFSKSEKIIDKEQGELRSLEFVAKDKEAPFGKLVYHYQEGKVVYTESYARSGVLLKKGYFEDFIKSSSGVQYATKIKVINSLMPENYSLIKIGELAKLDKLPDYYFTPEGLSKVED